VTIACTFRGSAGRQLGFDLLVDGRLVLTQGFESPSDAPVVTELRVPLRFTEGRSRISVTLRGVNGPAPGVIELATVQEHLE
jgi:hypothetical protein